MKEDVKRHMSINLETGLWRCFKTGNVGNFIKLYSILENIPYKNAYEKFLFEAFKNGNLEPKKKVPEVIEEDTSKFELVTCDSDNPRIQACYNLLKNRSMHDMGPFYYCGPENEKYKDRLIIPFLDRNNHMFFFQARDLGSSYAKYLNSKQIKASHVLYPFDYSSHEPLYVCEGVFDCLALKKAGLNATTSLSCYISKEQFEQLKFYSGHLVCAFDTDLAGQMGASKFITAAYRAKRSDLYRAFPGTSKDWNEYLITYGPELTRTMAKNLFKLDRLTLAVSGL